MKILDEDIRARRAEFVLALAREKQASPTVREMWSQLVAMLDDLLKRRATEKKEKAATRRENKGL